MHEVLVHRHKSQTRRPVSCDEEASQRVRAHRSLPHSTSGSSEGNEGSTNSAIIEPPTAEETPATSALMNLMAPVGLAGLCSRRSNAGQHQ